MVLWKGYSCQQNYTGAWVPAQVVHIYACECSNLTTLSQTCHLYTVSGHVSTYSSSSSTCRLGPQISTAPALCRGAFSMPLFTMVSIPSAFLKALQTSLYRFQERMASSLLHFEKLHSLHGSKVPSTPQIKNNSYVEKKSRI